MKPQRQDELGIACQAAEWFTALESGGAAERAAFAEWLARSPLHVQEFLNISAVHRMFVGVDPQRRIDVAALLKQAPGNVVTLPSSTLDGISDEMRSFPRRRRMMRLAAGIAVMALGGFWWFEAVGSWQSYTTAVGEQRAIELEDGSLVHLSANSQLRLRFDTVRDLRLAQGEALFTVAPDPERPFRVYAGSTVVQALGTQFNVNRRTRDTVVVVLEGAVQVSDDGQMPAKLQANEEARIPADGRIATRKVADATRATAWRERRLVFQSDTLEDMAAQFNRYNRAPKIVIEGEAIRQRRFTGVLDAGNPESLLNLLTEADDLVFSREDKTIVVRARRD